MMRVKFICEGRLDRCVMLTPVEHDVAAGDPPLREVFWGQLILFAGDEATLKGIVEGNDYWVEVTLVQ